MYFIQLCFGCRPSDSTVSEDAGTEPRTVATLALAVSRSYLLARSHPLDINVPMSNFVKGKINDSAVSPLGENNCPLLQLMDDDLLYYLLPVYNILSFMEKARYVP